MTYDRYINLKYQYFQHRPSNQVITALIFGSNETVRKLDKNLQRNADNSVQGNTSQATTNQISESQVQDPYFTYPYNNDK